MPEKIVLHQGDFLLDWQVVPVGSIDLIICDPPYHQLHAVHSWDRKIDFAALSWIFSNLATPTGQVALFCSATMIPEVVPRFGEYWKHRYTDVWQKPNAMVSHKDRPMPDVEFVSVFHRKRAGKVGRKYNWEDVAAQGKSYKRRNRSRAHPNRVTPKRELDINDSGLRYPSSVVHFPNRPAMDREEKRFANHPTQKSLAHMEYLIRLLSDEGQTVLDPFMGSGTTILAAQNTGRKAVGFELESKFYTMTKARLEHQVIQSVRH